ncbi:MAG: XRE family transcriptional regulator [Phycisphaerales bacterium]|jgi:antitoxin HicB|nr:XRE family transcriptional regulator [Phycisphaerales bacterium]
MTKSNTSTKKCKHSPLGSSFDEFLRDDNLYEEATIEATKRVLAMQLAAEMSQQHISKSEMARRMHTSRSALERLLDPENSSVTLQTLDKAARSLGRRIAVALI